jgi:thiamine kinase-like enzyme
MTSMCMSPFPPTKQAAVDRALTAAFGTTVLDSATPLTGGLSDALIYKVRVGGIAYLLRVEGSTDAFRDPARWHVCMGLAAQAFLAPRVRYACAADGVAIMDFIPERSLTLDYAGSKSDLVVELAQAVRALHQTPAFPSLVDYLDGMAAIIGQFQAAAPVAPEAVAELFSRYRDLAAVYRTLEPDLVSSHNDLNPRNVLYDGARLWLVDWESAFLADRWVDLAAVANFFTADAEGEELLLRTYFGETPDERRRARMLLARQINHVFYGLIFLIGAAAERPVQSPTLDAPPLADLHRAISEGEFTLGPWEERVTYGKARLNAALAGMRSPQFAEAVSVVSTLPLLHGDGQPA